MKNDMKIQRSFERVKMDMAQMYDYVQALNARLQEVENTNLRLVSAMTVLSEIAQRNQERALENKTVVKRISRSEKFVASKTAGKVHKESCAFAKNIKRQNMVEVSSKAMALKLGFKACKCMR